MLQEANLPFNTPEQQAEVAQVMLQQLADEYPNMAKVATAFHESGADYADEFEFGLDLILDGIERLRTAG